MDKLELIIFAAIAAVLVWKLFNTIGRTDIGKDQGEIKPNSPPNKQVKNNDTINPIKASNQVRQQPKPVIVQAQQEQVSESLKEGYDKVTSLDKTFTLAGFVGGAESAFEFILESFSKGDEKALKPLVSEDIHQSFASVIKDRETAKDEVENTLLGFEETKVEEIKLNKNTANILVKFVTEQINIVKNAQGKIIDGSSSQINKITDKWTFERNLLSADKSWKLVATD